MPSTLLRRPRRSLAFRLLTVVVLATLPGCDAPQYPPPPRQAMASHFAPGQGDTIEASIVDPLPVKAAVLKTADGGTIAAVQIDRERNLYSSDTGEGPNFGIRASGGSSSGVSTGFGFGFPLFGGGEGERTAALTTSTVRFKIPDLAVYRRDWQRWILHIELDDGASRRTIETLPPAPPAE
jgi:hypothetical protein